MYDILSMNLSPFGKKQMGQCCCCRVVIVQKKEKRVHLNIVSWNVLSLTGTEWPHSNSSVTNSSSSWICLSKNVIGYL